ncbi:MAG: hypothetical protein HYT72_02520 [Candidatus Aenigmarchaeota archaeon]|nr:hypothetical protein [Candidatus Aenigmarchaeota archaeon]
MKLILILFLVVVFAVGCVNTAPIITKGVLVKLDANPQEIFTGAKTTLSIDIDNKDVKTIRDVNVDVFETGLLRKSAQCSKSIAEMKPNAFDSFFCSLQAPGEIGAQKVATTVFARAGFTTSLTATQLVKIISQNEYDLRKKTGKFVTEPLSYAYRDNNLELLVEFSDNLPLIDSAGKKSYVSFTIRNIGNGFIEKISKGEIKITSPGLISCPDIRDMFISGTQFPKFTCELTLPGDITFLSDRTINIDIAYNYEVRNSIDVEIKR